MTAFKKVLIANRGAIATRIIRTLDRLGIESVAVYAESDRDSLHVQHATQSFSLGAGTASDTYLNINRLLSIAKETGCEAVHPGYGFLSENADFVERCDAASLIFIGPTAQQIRQFGQKHQARALAELSSVPLPPGTGLLSDLDEACQAAQRIGYPVMVKSTAGGGGIGMQLCATEAELKDAYTTVRRQSAANFANDGLFIEKAITNARHIEVQVFGDGKGTVVSLGERDCSAQRRHQKVIEECPAPDLTGEMRRELHETAERLMAQVAYRNAGTVEFILDADTSEFYFLEVNTRLQVEHGVTELVFGVDLVEWMVLQASGAMENLKDARARLQPAGHAVQMRVYAEDPYQNFQPCPGPLTEVSFPSDAGLRIDHWLRPGITVPAEFDPMLAKVMAHADCRKSAFKVLQDALKKTHLYGSETNLDYLKALSQDDVVLNGRLTTRYLNSFSYHPARLTVLRGGTMTTIQDYPGRRGYWSVGIPPSGPFDSLSFQWANQLLGNAADAAGLEITVQGPLLEFSVDTEVVITGAEVDITLDKEAVPGWTVLRVRAGQKISIGTVKDCGARVYLCVKQGIQCPDYLDSRSTFTLGRFGGHNGSALKAGDVLHLLHDRAADEKSDPSSPATSVSLPLEDRPALTNDWLLRVIYGPHGAPDFFTDADINMFFSNAWEVHYNSSRTGVRLIGPTPQWARSDGGEAGLHPSNIHDNAYAFGSIDFTGDMPVILGPDGPSLGGFVCPATVITADLWKIGQLRAGDTLRFQPVTIEDAVKADQLQQKTISQFNSESSAASGDESHPMAGSGDQSGSYGNPVVARRTQASIPAVYRVAGDRFLLIEYGEAVLDLVYRFRVYALMQWLEAHPLPGILELTPGIRSLQVHYDCQQLPLVSLLTHLQKAEPELDSSMQSASVPSRIVNLPLSWDDEACQLAVQKYHQSVRKDAPWYPSNLEFIRRINGLDSIDDVKRIVFDASYLVMGLGDVYLGAPVATPVNPAHRLVTTKYNPARTWTAENSVGIGGSYLCIYGMEGPGGYQFVGRTLQMWNRYQKTAEFSKPWLLRFFDQIRFFEVSADELKRIRQDFPHGRYHLDIQETEFSLQQFQDLVEEQAETIQAFERTRQTAFTRELDQWRASGQFSITHAEPEIETVAQETWAPNATIIESPVSGSVWQCLVAPGDTVLEGQTLLVLESMKMEINVSAPDSLTVKQILQEPGQTVSAGQALMVLEEK